MRRPEPRVTPAEMEALAERLDSVEEQLAAIARAIHFVFIRSGGCGRAEPAAILPAILRTLAELEDALRHARPRRGFMVGINVRTGKRLPDQHGTVTIRRRGEAPVRVHIPPPRRDPPVEN